MSLVTLFVRQSLEGWSPSVQRNVVKIFHPVLLGVDLQYRAKFC
jgi:hypothetical protein